jgi:hypothetical protein
MVFLVVTGTGKHLLYLRFSLVGSTSISMTYSINIRPYNDPYIKNAEKAAVVGSELLIPGAFLVDIIPILKYVPKWFPGAKFQIKAAKMRKYLQRIRNTTFSATEELMVCDSFTFSRVLTCLYVYIFRPAETMTPRSSQKH